MSHDLGAALALSDLLFDRQTLEAGIHRIAGEIDQAYAGTPGERPLLLTVMHGGLPFAAQLAMAMKTDLEFDYLHATRYRGNTTGSGLAWLHRPATPLRGRRVLIADDILDEGHTLKAVRNWCEDQGAARVLIAAMAVKQHERCVSGLEADYSGFMVPDQWHPWPDLGGNLKPSRTLLARSLRQEE